MASIKMVVFDWAGTTVDHGCFAPVSAFMKLFASRGVAVTVEQARVPMGLEKRAHILAMLNDPGISMSWRTTHRQAWTEVDLDDMYAAFISMQMEAVTVHCDLIPGALDAIRFLRKHGIATGGTTGYFEAAARQVEELARRQGFYVDANIWTEPGQPGRPGPALIHRLMKQLLIDDPRTVLKIGDTIHDVAEGLNAGAWSVAVLRGSSEMGLSRADYGALDTNRRADLLRKAGAKMWDAGAHAVIESLDDLPALIESINRCLSAGAGLPVRI